MKKVVSFSGGRTSAYLCYLMIEKFGLDNVDFIYMDTGAEHPKTYEFIRKVNDYLGLNLVCLRGSFNTPMGKGGVYSVVDVNDIGCDLKPFSSLCNKYGTPSVVGTWCTSRMKEETHDRYCNEKYGRKGYETWIGIRADEPRRLKGVGKRVDLRYMAEITDAEKQDVLDFWKKQPFDLEIDEYLGNCVFCIKKGANKLALAARDEPDLYSNWLEMISSAAEREDLPSKPPKCQMYRNRQTIIDIVEIYSDHSRDEIIETIRGMKSMESGSCSESCEVFVCESNQVDMFK